MLKLNANIHLKKAIIKTGLLKPDLQATHLLIKNYKFHHISLLLVGTVDLKSGALISKLETVSRLMKDKSIPSLSHHQPNILLQVVKINTSMSGMLLIQLKKIANQKLMVKFSLLLLILKIDGSLQEEILALKSTISFQFKINKSENHSFIQNHN